MNQLTVLALLCLAGGCAWTNQVAVSVPVVYRTSHTAGGFLASEAVRWVDGPAPVLAGAVLQAVPGKAYGLLKWNTFLPGDLACDVAWALPGSGWRIWRRSWKHALVGVLTSALAIGVTWHWCQP